MKRTILVIAISIVSLLNFAQENKYKVEIDINKLENDKLKVTVYPPAFEKEVAYWYFPSSVPGIYEDVNYSQLVSNFKVFDANGKKLKVKQGQIDEKFIPKEASVNIKERKKNIWQIINAYNIYKIEYYVDDTYDSKKLNYLFSGMAGTNFELNKNFVFNWGGIIGNFITHNNIPYEIEISKPEQLYGATSLKLSSRTNKSEQYIANNYFELMDNPLMYSEPDTSSFIVGKTKIEIAFYSEDGQKRAEKYLDQIKLITEAANNKYLDGLLKNKYTYIYYVPTNHGQGALEHLKSSFYYHNPDVAGIKDIIAHEVMHILTPHTLRSERIANFNFLFPLASKHLWLYEGITEYLSIKLQMENDIMKFENFLFEQDIKMLYAQRSNKLSLINLSNNVYNNINRRDFSTVYTKGALVAFLLDIRICELTNGELNLSNIMLQLKDKYKTKPFNDQEFIQEFITMTHPEIENFFNSYIIGSEELPFNEYIAKLGLTKEIMTKKFKSLTYGIEEFNENAKKKKYTVKNSFLLNEYLDHPLKEYNEIQILKVNTQVADEKSTLQLFGEKNKNFAYRIRSGIKSENLNIKRVVKEGEIEKIKVGEIDNNVEPLTIDILVNKTTQTIKIPAKEIEYTISTNKLRKKMNPNETEKQLYKKFFKTNFNQELSSKN